MTSSHKETFGHRIVQGIPWPAAPPWLLPVILTVLLRGWNLETQSVWYDDYNCAGYLGCERFLDFIAIIREQNPEGVPLYYILVYVWAKWIGTSGTAARWFSVTLHGVAAWALYRAGTALAGRRAGMTAALWFACSPWQVWHGQSVRPYPLVTLLACLMLWSLILCMRGADRGKRFAVPAGLAALALLPWTHLTTLVLLPALLTGWVLSGSPISPLRKRMKLKIPAILLVCWIPLMYWVLHLPMVSALAYSMYHPPDGLRSLFAVVAPDAPQRMGEVLAGFPELWDPWLPHMVLLRDLLEWLLAAVGLGAIIVSGRRAFRKTASEGGPGVRSALRMIWVTALLPPVILIVLSYIWRPCFMPRYLTASIPALYLLIGTAAALLPRRWCTTALLLPAVPLVLTWMTCLASVTRTDWGRAADRIRQEVREHDLILSPTLLIGVPLLEYHLDERHRYGVATWAGRFRIQRAERVTLGPGWVYPATLGGNKVAFGQVITPLQAIEMASAYAKAHPETRVWMVWEDTPYGAQIFFNCGRCLSVSFATVTERVFRGQFPLHLVRMQHPAVPLPVTKLNGICAVEESAVRAFWEAAAGETGRGRTEQAVDVLRRSMPAALPADLTSVLWEMLILCAMGHTELSRLLIEANMSRFPEDPGVLLSLARHEAFSGGDCEVVNSWLRKVSDRSRFFGLYSPAIYALCRTDLEAFERETIRLERMGIPWIF